MRKILEFRAGVLRAIRAFFDDRGFLEVETPVRIPVPALEQNVDPEPSGEWHLRTSPEFHMKRLLCSGCDKIYQIGPCFRKGESGRLHTPEFTMLEWYRTKSDYLDILTDTKALIAFVAEQTLGRTWIDFQAQRVELMPIWDIINIKDAFLLNAGWNPVDDLDEDRFDFDLVTKVEPALPVEQPVVLIDYPAELAAMARRKPKKPELAERWELYIGGVEIANAFSELTDPVEQRQRFQQWSDKRRKAGKPPGEVDEQFMQALEAGMPECGGIALGVDRLIMLLAEADALSDILPFS